MFNAALHPCRFVLPPPPTGKWRLAVDTAQTPPADIPDLGYEKEVADEAILIGRSSAIVMC